MFNPIYKPKASAVEGLEDFALNIYPGCPGRCDYCYAPSVLRRNREEFHTDIEPHTDIVKAVSEQLGHWKQNGISGRVIHMCYACDPWPRGYLHDTTFEIIRAIKQSGNHVQLLTKNYLCESADGELDIYRLAGLLDDNDCFGISYDGTKGIYSSVMEACVTAASSVFNMHGIARTWVAFEPVLDEEEVLRFLKANRTNIDMASFNILENHPKPDNVESWESLGTRAEELCREIGLRCLIKPSLREAMEGGSDDI